MAESQMVQAEQDREEFDRAQPKGRGTPAAMLQAAEQELAKLEKLLPLEGDRQSASQQIVSAEDQVRQAIRPYRKARRRWRAALSQAAMPDHLTPLQVRRILRTRGTIGLSTRKSPRDGLTWNELAASWHRLPVKSKRPFAMLKSLLALRRPVNASVNYAANCSTKKTAANSVRHSGGGGLNCTCDAEKRAAN